MSKTEENDKVVLKLKAEIAEKRKELKASEKFVPVTNCSLEFVNERYNLHTLNEQAIIALLVRLNALRMSAVDLGLLDKTIISGFHVDEWMTDLKARLAIVNRKEEETKLKRLEDRLKDLLSNDTKVELEIEEIKRMMDNA